MLIEKSALYLCERSFFLQIRGTDFPIDFPFFTKNIVLIRRTYCSLKSGPVCVASMLRFCFPSYPCHFVDRYDSQPFYMFMKSHPVSMLLISYVTARKAQPESRLWIWGAEMLSLRLPHLSSVFHQSAGCLFPSALPELPQCFQP